MDPINGPMRLQLETATQGILRDLLEGTPQLSYQLSHSSYRLRHDPDPLHAPSEQILSERLTAMHTAEPLRARCLLSPECVALCRERD